METRAGVFGAADAGDGAGVEVGGIVFCEDFALGHGGWWVVGCELGEKVSSERGVFSRRDVDGVTEGVVVRES